MIYKEIIIPYIIYEGDQHKEIEIKVLVSERNNIYYLIIDNEFDIEYDSVVKDSYLGEIITKKLKELDES